MNVTLHAFDGRTGAHISRLSYSALSWSDEIRSDGSIDATVDWQIPERTTRPWATIVAAVSDHRVLHAGYLMHARHRRSDGVWELSGGGGATILSKRLVLNKALRHSWADGEVVVDEDNPAGDWPLQCKGSYSDIISLLVRETLAWGELPLIAAPLTGGDKERNYNSYDLATVYDRIEDIGELEHGPEWRFDAELTGDWHLQFRQVTSEDGGEIIDHSWMWNAQLPESGVKLEDVDAEGEDMCTQSYLTGGRDEDKLLVARSLGSSLTDIGWPVLQMADTSHSTVSILSTLQKHARGLVDAGDDEQRTIGVVVNPEVYDVHVGDHADVRFGSSQGDVLALKVVGISWSTSDAMLHLSCKERT